jgi:hypothetical protein
MAPLPCLCASEPLKAGQTTIFSTLNGGLGVVRPPLPPRLGPKPKINGKADTVLGRRLTGGQNEKQVVELFATCRLAQSDTVELGDDDIANGVAVIEEESEDEDDEYEYILRRRYAYSREHKLAAIDYFQTTWKKTKDDGFKHLSTRFAARKLKITRRMLRSWVLNKEKILAQKKGSFRARKGISHVREPVMEERLNNEFEKARGHGRKISYKWMLHHARNIYSNLHPERVIHHDSHKKTYLGFRFSSGWYTGFKQRFNISLRCGTKRAQKAPEDLLPAIQS